MQRLYIQINSGARSMLRPPHLFFAIYPTAENIKYSSVTYVTR